MTDLARAASESPDDAMGIIDPALAAMWVEGRSTSVRLTKRARKVFPDGVTHDNRYQEPSLLYVERADGAHKWDVDGNEYVDYWMGHGSLLLGHAHPVIVRAVQDQVERGTHFGASHELEVIWGEIVQRLVPSARGGLVKFTSSGTEATLLAMRMARAHAGKQKILKARGHFHGWHDYATFAMVPPFDRPNSRGIPEGLLGSMVDVPAGDLDALEKALAEDDEIAGVILVPGGGADYLRGVRELTNRHQVVLIFDEVITGFRLAPGGAQELFGVTPDLTTLAKILAGGLSGGAVAGRADLFEPFLLKPWDSDWWRWGRIPHPGTFNANPLSAAAGIACLTIAANPSTQQAAAETAAEIRRGIVEILERQGVEGSAGGIASIIEVAIGGLSAGDPRFRLTLKVAMQVRGVDVSGSSWWVSIKHSKDDVQRTLEAFDYALPWVIRARDGR
jgi:glutamate-1-semialdehyde 2,1-aminomutase